MDFRLARGNKCRNYGVLAEKIFENTCERSNSMCGKRLVRSQGAKDYGLPRLRISFAQAKRLGREPRADNMGKVHSKMDRSTLRDAMRQGYGQLKRNKALPDDRGISLAGFA